MRQLAAVCQVNSTNEIERNLDICTKLIIEASMCGATVVFLPECFDFVSRNKDETLDLAESLDGPIISHYKKLAKEKNIWLSLGGFHEKILDKNSVYISHVMISSCGEVEKVYRKTHLFQVELKGVSLNEHESVTPGDCISPPIKTPIGNVGLQVCYDLRFPEISKVQREMGADVLTFPSAFTLKTGLAHWHVLLRARAIENQCYVIAAAQTGTHSEKRESYGHALIADPWGTVLSECGEGNTIALSHIDSEIIKDIRTRMPVSSHSRYDLYNNPKK